MAKNISGLFDKKSPFITVMIRPFLSRDHNFAVHPISTQKHKVRSTVRWFIYVTYRKRIERGN